MPDRKDLGEIKGWESIPTPSFSASAVRPDRKELSEIEPPVSLRGVGFSAIFGHQWKQAKVINLEMLGRIDVFTRISMRFQWGGVYLPLDFVGGRLPPQGFSRAFWQLLEFYIPYQRTHVVQIPNALPST